MKIHPRTGCGIIAITINAIGLGLQTFFKWDLNKTVCIIMILYSVIHIPLYDYLHDEYCANDNTPKENAEENCINKE